MMKIKSIAGYMNGHYIKKSVEIECTVIEDSMWNLQLMLPSGATVFAKVEKLVLDRGLIVLDKAIVNRDGCLAVFEGICLTDNKKDVLDGWESMAESVKLRGPSQWFDVTNAPYLEGEFYIVFSLLETVNLVRKIDLPNKQVCQLMRDTCNDPLCLVSTSQEVTVKFNKLKVLEGPLGYLITSEDCNYYRKNDLWFYVDTCVIRLLPKEYVNYQLYHERVVEELLFDIELRRKRNVSIEMFLR